jgi:hypothetical protein
MKHRISIGIILSVTVILGLFPRTASPQRSDWRGDEMPIWMMMSEAKTRVGPVINCGGGCDDPQTQACCGTIVTPE